MQRGGIRSPMEPIMRKPKMKKPTNSSGPVVKLAVSNQVITHEEMAALDFKPIPTFVGLNDSIDKMERHETFLRKIAIMSRSAVSLLGLPKAEIIANIRKGADRQSDDEIFKALMDGREAADELADMIKQAETRFACAMANVYNEDGSPRPLPDAS
jgi:hypothetical protein